MVSRAVDWLEELRAPFFTASIVPVLLGAAVVVFEGHALDPLLLALTLGGVVLLHAGTNMANDYFDHRHGTDDVNREFIRPFSGGSRKIQDGRLEPGAIHRAALSCLAAGAVIGLLLFALTGGYMILVFGIIGVVSGYMYSAPPLRLSSRGLGEMTVGLNFGLLIVLGTYYVQTLALSWTALAAALPIAFLITAVLHVNQFPDARADEATGKATLVVRLGAERSVMTQAAFMALAVFSIIAGVLAGLLPLWVLLGLIPLPMTASSVSVLMTGVSEGRRASFAAACDATVRCHLATGLLLVAGLLLSTAVA